MIKHLIITVADDQVHNTEKVVNSLEGCGLKVEQVFPFGVITGSAEIDHIPRLRANPGVAFLDEDQPIRIPPPDSPIQ